MNGFLSLLPGERGRQTVDYPTKKATIKGGRRFIAPTSFDDSSTALLVSVRLALRPLRSLMAQRAGPKSGQLGYFREGIGAGVVWKLRVGVDADLELLEQFAQAGLAVRSGSLVACLSWMACPCVQPLQR